MFLAGDERLASLELSLERIEFLLEPWHRIQGLGLVPLLQGNTIIALTSTEAAVRTRSGAMQAFRRKQADPLYPAERCLIWELDHE